MYRGSSSLPGGVPVRANPNPNQAELAWGRAERDDLERHALQVVGLGEGLSSVQHSQ
jgi:hypothetical protein